MKRILSLLGAPFVSGVVIAHTILADAREPA